VATTQARLAEEKAPTAYSDKVFETKVGNPKGVVQVVYNGVSQAEFEPIEPVRDSTDLESSVNSGR